MTYQPIQVLSTLWVVFYVLTALAVASHALFHKRDPRSAWGWIAVCWLFPLGGAVLYWLFGINRVEKYARGYSDRTHAKFFYVMSRSDAINGRISCIEFSAHSRLSNWRYL